jgi:hypothetical protein
VIQKFVVQKNIVSHTDPYCKKVTGEHFRTMSDNYPQSQGKDESPCSYHIVYEDKSHSEGVIIRANLQVQITDIVTGVSVVHADETLLG